VAGKILRKTFSFIEILRKYSFFKTSQNLFMFSSVSQVFTPHMQSPENGGKTKEHILGDIEQGSFSISLWKNAFKVTLSRLCPMRGARHECGCLPILAKMVFRFYILKLKPIA